MRLFHSSLIAALLCAGADVAQAAPQISSQYEKISYEACKQMPSDSKRIGLFSCTTKMGPDLILEYSEHSTWVYLKEPYDAGKYDSDKYNGPYTPGKSGHFGSMFENEDKLGTLEWRVVSKDGQWQPFALIYRTTYADFSGSDGESKPRSRLEIIKFGPDHGCHLGFVEGLEAGHNGKARALADANLEANTCPPGN